jgi:hypothetical protein
MLLISPELWLASTVKLNLQSAVLVNANSHLSHCCLLVSGIPASSDFQPKLLCVENWVNFIDISQSSHKELFRSVFDLSLEFLPCLSFISPCAQC